MFEKINNNLVHLKYNQKDMFEPNVIEHYNSIVDIGNIFYIIPTSNINCSFLYISTDSVEYLYYFGEKSENDILYPLYVNSNNEYVYGIDKSDKQYCIELKFESNNLHINFITTESENCKKVFCNKLNGLFSVLYIFLKTVNYTGKITLEDDVMINGKFITYDRIINNKPSIYEKYGFEIEKNRLYQINNALADKNYDKLKILSRCIPMYANNIDKFNHC